MLAQVVLRGDALIRIVNALRTSMATNSSYVLPTCNLVGIDSAVGVNIDESVVVAGRHGPHIEFDGDRVS